MKPRFFVGDRVTWKEYSEEVPDAFTKFHGIILTKYREKGQLRYHIALENNEVADKSETEIQLAEFENWFV